MQNIDIVFNGKANFSGARQQLDALRQSYAQLGNAIKQSNIQASQQGQAGQATIAANSKILQDLRMRTMDAASASQAFYTTQTKLTAASTRFNDALSKQKMSFSGALRNMSVLKEAYKEQLAIQNMMVTGWTRNANGQISADLMIPRDLNGRIDTLRSKLGYYNQVVASGAEGMINWGKNTQWAGRQLMVGFTVPTTMAIAAISKMGFEMDKALTSIVKVYGDAGAASAEQTAKIRNDAMKTATAASQLYGQSFKDTLAIQQQLAAAGGPNSTGNALQQATLEVTRAKTLGELDLQDAMKTTITLMNAYDMKGKDLTDTFNFMNSIENQTVLSMQDMTEGLPRVSGIMESLGVSVQQTSVFLTAFKAAGIDAAEGANALKSIAFKAIAPTPTAESFFKQITGSSLKEIVDGTHGELLPTLAEISKAMDSVDKQGKVDIAARVFGIQQGSKGLALIDQLKNLQDTSTQVGKSWQVANQSSAEWAQTAQGEMEALYNSASNRMQRAITSITNSWGQLGQVVLPVVSWILEKVSGLATWIDHLDGGTKAFILGFAGITALIGPMVMLTGLFGNFLGTIIKTVSNMANLALRFKVVNAETRAGQLIAEAASAQFTAEGAAAANLSTALQTLNMNLQQTLHAQTQIAAAAGHTIVPLPTNGPNPPVPPANAASQWANLSNKISGTAMALGAVATVAGGDSTIGKIGNVAFVVGTFATLLPSLTKLAPALNKVKTAIAGISSASAVASLRSSAAFGRASRAASGIGSALQTVSTFAIGPWGLAIAAAVGGVYLAVKKINDEVAASRDSFKAAADSAKTWQSVIGFDAPTNQAPAADSSSPVTFNQDIDKLKSENEDLYNNFVRIRESNASLEEKIQAALQQGIIASQNGADASQVAKTVQIALTAMGAAMSQQEFNVTVKPRILVDPKELSAQSDAMIGQIQDAIKDAITPGGTDTTTVWEDIGRTFTGSFNLTGEEAGKIQSQVKTFWEIYDKENNVQQKESLNKLKGAFLDPLKKQYDDYAAHQKELGYKTESFNEYLDSSFSNSKTKDAMNNLLQVTNEYFKLTGSSNELKNYDQLVAYLAKHQQAVADATVNTNDVIDASGKKIETAVDYWKQLDDALTDYNITSQNVVDSMKDVMNAASNQAAEIANNAWSDKVNARMQAIADEFDAKAKAVDDRANAAKDAADREDKALKARQKGESDALSKIQDKQTKDVTNMWDLRIKAIDDAVKAEQDANDARQKIFDAEKERVQRWHDLYEKQMDYQQAIAAGNLDTAARAQNDIMAMQQGYAITDAAANADDASKARQDQISAQKDALEQQKQNALDALKAQQDAEMAALDARQAAEEDALKKKQDIEQQRFQAQKDSLSKQEQAAKDSANRQLNIEKMKLDSEMAALQAYVPKNETEMQAHLKQIEALYAAHGVQVNLTGGQWSQILNNSILNGTKAAVMKFRSDIDWADAGKEAAAQMIAGAFPGMTMDKFVHFIQTGELPDDVAAAMAKSTAQQTQAGYANKYAGARPAYHVGGIAGVTSGGYANMSGHPDEFDAKLLKGEGILNRGAMGLPGMTDFVMDANAGKLPKNIGGSDPIGFAGAPGLVASGVFRAMLSTAMGIGIAKAQQKAMANMMGSSGSISAIAGAAGKYGNTVLSAEQLDNAAKIVGVGKSMGATQRDLIVALMTAMQESSLRNLSYGDRDSLGLFQQRPSAGWGTPAQIMDPSYSSQKFFSALFGVKGRDTMALWQEAQAVQRSAFPTAYAQWQDEAEAIIASMQYTQAAPTGAASAAGAGGWIKPANGPRTSPFGMRVNPVTGVYRLHDGSDIGAPLGSAIYAAKSGTVASVSQYNPAWAGLYTIINHGGGLATGYAHQSAQMVTPGQIVQGGQQIGRVGSTGNSTGPHLHFQYFRDGKALNPNLIIPGMLTGGMVDMGGLAMLHQGEMVVPKPLTDSVTRGLAGGLGSQYTVTVDLRGAYIKEEINVQEAVEKALQNVERRKGPNRKVG